MSGVEYLELEDILQLVRQLGVGPVRDLGLLDSAVARPRSSAFGEDAYSSLSLKAAALLHSLTNDSHGWRPRCFSTSMTLHPICPTTRRSTWCGKSPLRRSTSKPSLRGSMSPSKAGTDGTKA